MRPDPAPLPGLATDEEMAAGRPVVRCGMCGRRLTGRAARLRGLGEGCRHKLDGDVSVRRPGAERPLRRSKLDDITLDNMQYRGRKTGTIRHDKSR